LVRTSPCFFFQAEDGIRGLIVTGVQTCALPILVHARSRGVQPLAFMLSALRHPLTMVKASAVRDWSRRTIILLVMQTLDNSIRLDRKSVVRERAYVGRGAA